MRSNILAATLLAICAVIHLILLVVVIAYFRRADLLMLPPPMATYLLSLLAAVVPLAGFALSACSSLSTAGAKRLFFSKAFLKVYQLLGLVDASVLSIAATFLDPTFLNCALESQWQQAFMRKDAKAIAAIQDSKNCCGFNSVHDRAYPFPDHDHGATLCSVTHRDRSHACGDILRNEARGNLKTLIGVCIVLLIVKGSALLLSRMKIFEAVEGHLAWMADERAEWRQARIDYSDATGEGAAANGDTERSGSRRDGSAD